MFRLLLDFDGTICDSRYAIAETLSHAIFEIFKLELAQDFVLHHISYGTGLELTIERILKLNDVTFSEALIQQSSQFYRDSYATVGSPKERLYPGALETLAELAKTEKLLVVTNKTESAVEIAAERLGVTPFIDGIVGARLGQIKKPDPALYELRIAEYLGPLNRELSLMVGDTRSDAKFAENLQIPFAWAAFGFVSEWHSDWSKCDFEIQQFAELKTVVEKLSK